MSLFAFRPHFHLFAYNFWIVVVTLSQSLSLRSYASMCCLFACWMNGTVCIAFRQYFRFAPQFLVATIHSIPFTFVNVENVLFGFTTTNEQASIFVCRFVPARICEKWQNALNSTCLSAEKRNLAKGKRTNERKKNRHKLRPRISYRQIQLQ